MLRADRTRICSPSVYKNRMGMPEIPQIIGQIGNRAYHMIRENQTIPLIIKNQEVCFYGNDCVE